VYACIPQIQLVESRAREESALASLAASQGVCVRAEREAAAARDALDAAHTSAGAAAVEAAKACWLVPNCWPACLECLPSLAK
jgi:hypothetical protein